MAAAPASLGDLLRLRARAQPEARAFVFVSDRGEEEGALTFAALLARAEAFAATLAAHGGAGERALLLFAPGLDFLVAFFGCILAGVVAVPLMPPRRAAARDSSAAILADCAPRFALTSAPTLAARPDLPARFSDVPLEWLVAGRDEATPPAAALAGGAGEDVAFLQYTSGSTSTPKGVMVSHANLLANLEMIRRAFGNTRASTYVSWVPLYHDMGLILNVLQALHAGALCVLMSPVSFVQRPLSWLRLIHRYRAEVAGAPNFAFDHCVARLRPEQIAGLDLSGWRVAFNGAEPVRAATLERFCAAFAPYGFRPQALYPCYGLAEATLLVSGGARGEGARVLRASGRGLQADAVRAPQDAGDAARLVSCGRVLAGERIAIADPETGARLPARRIGEVWVAGPHVARGYWRKPAESAATFRAQLGAEAGEWLRTGDYGFLDGGELFITGRIKDLIIVRGMNHYPQDIEHTVAAAHPLLRPHGGVAFTAGEGEAQRLVVVQEVEGGGRGGLDVAEIEAAIRERVAAEHELSVDEVVLTLPGTVPKTTSGKLQRRLACRLWLDGALARL